MNTMKTVGLMVLMMGLLMLVGQWLGQEQGLVLAFGVSLLLILAPIAAMMIQFAISRSREFAADAGGAKISKKPLGLASALRKLEAGVERHPMENAGTTTAHLFIVNPLRGGGMLRLFSTHPPAEERIARLEQLAVQDIF